LLKGQLKVEFGGKMGYHVFRKPKKLKNGKTVHRWYYYYHDENGKQVQKACKRCKSRKEAEDYIRSLSDAAGDNVVLIKGIAETMFLPNSDHMNRRNQLGRVLDRGTMLQARRYIKLIIDDWGDKTIVQIDPAKVVKFLFATKRSGSWKNRYISIFREICIEAQWYRCKTPPPYFQRFTQSPKKADIFTTDELKRLFIPENFPSYMFYLFFLLGLSGGLRLGEMRAIRPKQILFDKNALIVDGFCKTDGSRTSYNKTGTPDNPRFRVVLLPDFTTTKMAEYITANGTQPDDLCRALYVFTTALAKVGIIMSPKAVRQDGYSPKPNIPRAVLMPDGRKLTVHYQTHHRRISCRAYRS
jgi:integrase